MENRYKFRGKRLGTNEGEWVYGVPWEAVNGTGAIYMRTECIYEGGPAIAEIRIDQTTLGQCTGLMAAKSYRGTVPDDLLIYEGDICGDNSGWEFEVTWDSENARFLGRHSKPRGDTYVCYVGREPAAEIIGCVHDLEG